MFDISKIALGVALGATLAWSMAFSNHQAPDALRITEDGLFSPFRDVTDTPDGPRSGMVPFIDYGTNCQYLWVRGGGLTPRLAPDGKPICGEVN